MRKGLSHSEAGALANAGELSHKRKLLAIEKYNSDPKRCKFCLEAILYDKRKNDFCNHSCAAKFSNKLKGLNSSFKEEVCLYCNSLLLDKVVSKYCTRKCMFAFWWQESKKILINDGYDTSYNHKTAKKFLVEMHCGKCQICGLSEWNGQKMPLVLDHINGNSEDGHIINLRVICNNCDALTDTYKAKNKGNGRAKRRKRYQEGKSY